MLTKSTVLFVLTVFVLGACAPNPPAPDVSMQKPTEVMAEEPAMPPAEEAGEPMAGESSAAMTAKSSDMDDAQPDEMMQSSPETDMATTAEGMEEQSQPDLAWLNTPLTDVRSGEKFTIVGYKGKVVLVENLAMWCPNCKRQQEQVVALHGMLGMDSDLVSVGLDIDKNENAADLKTYIEKNGFDWVYAVAPAGVTREIGDLYGQQFLNPSSTPVLIVDRKGQVHPMPFGVKSAEDLKDFIDPFLLESM